MPRTNLTIGGWRKSTYSQPDGHCVEIGFAPGVTGVRDTKDRGGGTLNVPNSTWSAFLSTIKAGSLDL